MRQQCAYMVASSDCTSGINELGLQFLQEGCLCEFVVGVYVAEELP